MKKKLFSILLVCSFLHPSISVQGEQLKNSNIQTAIDNWNKENREYTITPSDADILYLNTIPDYVNAEIYKRDIPDIRNKILHGTSSVIVNDGQVAPWYQSIPKEEKQEELVKRSFMTDGMTFSDGYKLATQNNFNTILVNLMTGDPQMIKRANEILVERLGENENLVHGSGDLVWPFTDVQPYVIWYDYKHLLTKDAQDALYRYIHRAGLKPSGFSPAKAAGELPTSVFHNQSSEGFLMGVLYAEIANDAKMLKRMEENIDRAIAQLAMFGNNGDEYSPGYGGFTYTNYTTAYNYVKSPRIKAKLKLLLERYNMTIVNFYHTPSGALSGPYHRAYGVNRGNVGEKQDYRTIIYLNTDGYNFWGTADSNGYAFAWSNLASLKFYFPDYVENFIKNKPFPYETKKTVNLINEPGMLHLPHGNQGAAKEFRITNQTVYETEEYTIGATLPQWNMYGNTGQNVVMRGAWRRNYNPEDNIDFSDIANLFTSYNYNNDFSLDGGEYVKKAGDIAYAYPSDEGKEFALQSKNKVIVAGWPSLVPDTGLHLEEINDMGETAYINNVEELKGVWHGDKFLFGEINLLTTEKEEVRLKLSTGDFPYNLKGDDKIFIEDFNTFVAVQPLNTTSLGRDVDVQLRTPKEDWVNAGIMPDIAVSHNFLGITAYNYYSAEKKNIPIADRSRQRNGFIFEFGERKEYANMSEFVAHINKSKYETYDEINSWIIKYESGDDSIELNIDTSKIRANDCFVNGEKLLAADYNKVQDGMQVFAQTKGTETDQRNNTAYYLWDKTEFYDWLNFYPFNTHHESLRTNNMVQSSAKNIVLGDIELQNDGGCVAFLAYEHISKTYILMNLSNKTGKFTLKTPDGIVDVLNLNLGTVRFTPNEDEQIALEIVPNMTFLKTTATLRR